MEKEKRSELLEFQKSLSKQFSAIVNEDKNNDFYTDVEEDKLGITIDFKDVQLFIGLEDLKVISAQNRYEKSLRSKSWLLGYTQERGDVYTIFELEKAIKLIVKGISDYDKIDERGKQIVFLKDVDSNKQALLLDLNNESLQYTAEYTPLFNLDKKEGKYGWVTSEDIAFESFVQEKNLTPFEWKVVSYIKNREEEKEFFNDDEFIVADPHIIFTQIIKRVYLDGMGVRPVFSINIENFTKYLSIASPF